MMTKLKKNKGITLIALVITIIILIILAGISINILFGQYGIVTRVNVAKEETRAASVQEERDLWLADIQVYKNTGGEYKDLNTILGELKAKKLLTEEEVQTILNDENNEITIASRKINFKINLENNGDTEQEKVLSDWEYTISDSNNTIILTKYIGTNPEITVCSTYTLNNKTYNTIIKKQESYGKEGPFVNNEIITKIAFEDNVQFELNDMSYLFYKCSNLKDIDFNNLDTSKVYNMSSMFSGCSNLANLDLGNFNTSNVLYMGSMFASCRSLTSLNLSHFNTLKVMSMDTMFFNCSNIENLDLENFDTPMLESCRAMFSECTNLKTLNLNNLKCCSNAGADYYLGMTDMFHNCSSLTSINLNNFDTRYIKIMEGMFSGCSSLTTLDLSSFNTSSVTKMNGMFSGCSSLTSINLSSFDTSNVTDMGSMFVGCSSLTTLDLSNFNILSVTLMPAMFARIW